MLKDDETLVIFQIFSIYSFLNTSNASLQEYMVQKFTNQAL